MGSVSVSRVDPVPGFRHDWGASTDEATHYARKGDDGRTDYLIRAPDGTFSAFRFRFSAGTVAISESADGLSMADALAWFDDDGPPPSPAASLALHEAIDTGTLKAP